MTQDAVGYDPLHHEANRPNPGIPRPSHQFEHGQEHVRAQQIFRFWVWEILSLVFCLGLVAAIFAVLASFDGRRVPDWGFSINLGTLVALLATIFRASLVMIIASVISQAKWSWFSSPGRHGARPLRHLDDFDSASRSALGAMYLIPTVIFQSPVTFLAVLIIITSAATGPFVQQAVKVVECAHVVPDLKASVPIAHYVPGSTSYYRVAPGMWELENDMKGALIAGLSNPAVTKSSIVATCPTGNCTFPSAGVLETTTGSGPKNISYSSMGVCSRCADVTSLVTGPHPRNGSRFGDLRLPTGAAVSFDAGFPYLSLNQTTNLSWAGDLVPRDMSRDISWALANFTVLTAVEGPSSTANRRYKDDSSSCACIASACAVYPCLRVYSASVAGGVLLEEQITSMPAVPDLFNYTGNGTAPSGPLWPPLPPGPFSAVQTPCRLPSGTIYTAENISSAPDAVRMVYYAAGDDDPPDQPRRVERAAPIDCIYRMDEVYAQAVARFLRSLLTGRCTYDPSRQAGFLDCGDRFSLDAFFHRWTATAESITETAEGLALAATNKMRLTGKAPRVDNIPDPAVNMVYDSVAADVWQTSVCTSVDWKWLLLPALLAALGAVALGVAILRTWRQSGRADGVPVWKWSALPLLFYGDRFASSDGSDRLVAFAAGRPLMNIRDMDRLADSLPVRFQTDTFSTMEKANEQGPLGGGYTAEAGRRRDDEDADVDSLLIRDEDRQSTT